ncbi:MAG TPA: hypothetical protein VGG39_30645 [Polyangiaceae bacterium]|jgi:hypothetical protein
MADEPERRCGTCARFVRVVETIDDTGEVRRHGECLLGVWPSPLYDTSTCSQWVRRGEFKAKPPERPSRTRSPRGFGGAWRGPGAGGGDAVKTELVLPEDLLDMDAEEFRRVLSEVIRDELGTGEAQIAGKWEGGEVVLRPGKPGVQEKRIPIDALFHKVVMIRDKLRVLEQKINGNPKLAVDEKLQLQQYVTGCYGSLTTFNVLFSNRDDQFVGQKGDE